MRANKTDRYTLAEIAGFVRDGTLATRALSQCGSRKPPHLVLMPDRHMPTGTIIEPDQPAG